MGAAAKAGLALGIFVGVNIALYFGSENYYLWAKSFHIVAMVSWMVGLFYLPRLFVYHVDAKMGSDKAETFGLMERRLMKIIMTPAMVLTWVFGFYLAGQLGAFPLWLLFKLIAVLGLTVFHFVLAGAIRKIALKPDYKSARDWRLYNEIPTILMIVIVLLVVIKPF